MKIYDCFMYFDEDIVLSVRLEELNKYVDFFVIIESTYSHNGEERNLHFDINKFSKFKEKIIYKVYNEIPKNIIQINISDNEDKIKKKKILNAIYRENSQRNCINLALKNVNENDLILISDIDEIPNLYNLDIHSISEKIIMFKQQMFYYKFNLKLPNFTWYGTKACKYKFLKSPQWLRNIKNRKYNFLRLDILFSEKKYNNVKFIENGGWHFTYIKSPKNIKKKLKSYLHHVDYEDNPIDEKNIDKLVSERKAIYDHEKDKRNWKKIGTGQKLVIETLENLPKYITKNKKNLEDWLDK